MLFAIFDNAIGFLALLIIISVIIDICGYFSNEYHKSTKNPEKLRYEYDFHMRFHRKNLKEINEWWHSKWQPSKEIPEPHYLDKDSMPDVIYKGIWAASAFGHPGVDGDGIEKDLSLPYRGRYDTKPDRLDERFNHIKYDYWPEYQEMLYVDKWGRTFGWDQWEKMNLTLLRERKVIIEQKLTEAEIRAQRLNDKDEYSGANKQEEYDVNCHNQMVITMQEGLAQINSIIDRKVERMNRR